MRSRELSMEGSRCLKTIGAQAADPTRARMERMRIIRMVGGVVR